MLVLEVWIVTLGESLVENACFGMSSKSVKKERPARVSSKTVKQECPAKVSSKSVKQECPAGVSSRSVQ